MIKIEKYTGDKAYMYPNGALATPEAIAAEFPAVAYFPHIVETDQSGQVMRSMENLAAVRSLYNIDTSLDDDAAIQMIEDIRNAPQEPVVTDDPLDRIASALEAQASGVEGTMIDDLLEALEGGVNNVI
ncbi:hypothetical protein LJC27_01770 [Christensenellaceae bacterium OttesenSCG-928-M15]|nr:hypothetical protein [Christensenellaceae bacterium OttesenSCG-928-M15]